MTDTTPAAASTPANGPWNVPLRTAPATAPAPERNSFPRKVWKLLVAIKDGLALVFLLLFFAMLFGLLAGRPNSALPVSEGALLLNLDGYVTEQPSDIDPLAVITGAGGPQVAEIRLRDVVHAIETAASDDRVTAVVLDLDRFLGGGQVALSEIGDALDTVRAAKKPVLAYATAYTDDSYLLAAHASEVWVDGIGGAMIAGPGGSRLYYKELLDRIGVTANIYRVGTFKSAVEPYLRSDQSPEAKAADQAYATALWDDWLADVRKARPKARVDAYVADTAGAVRAAGNRLSEAGKAAGLIDTVGTRMAFEERVGEIVGVADEEYPWAYDAIPYDSWVAANPPEESGTAIAVVPVIGEIVDGETGSGLAGGDTIAQHIIDAAMDEDVAAIVLRVDSPGGSVIASEQIRQATLLAKSRKLPIVVSMGNVAASGGYWIATPADRIFAQPDTITGSIGVFGILPSFEKALAKVGVAADGIKTTPLSGQPDVFGGVSPSFNDLAQASVEDVYARFTGLVGKSRKLSPEKVEALAEGRVWAGGDARQLGLIDQFGGLDDAIAAAAKLAKVEGDVYPRYFENAPDGWASLFGTVTAKVAAPHRAAAPRGWFALAAQQRLSTEARVLSDLALLMQSPSLQASCLECRGYAPQTARAPVPANTSWWNMLGALAR